MLQMGKRELVALLSLSSWCLEIVVWLFLAVPWVCLQFVIVVFPDHTHLLFSVFLTIYSLNLNLRLTFPPFSYLISLFQCFWILSRISFSMFLDVISYLFFYVFGCYLISLFLCFGCHLISLFLRFWMLSHILFSKILDVISNLFSMILDVI